jgi:hypothetical protein
VLEHLLDGQLTVRCSNGRQLTENPVTFKVN